MKFYKITGISNTSRPTQHLIYFPLTAIWSLCVKY